MNQITSVLAPPRTRTR